MASDYQYQKLEKWLRRGILAQRWQPGERIPSIRLLCREHKLSKATVQHALQRLEAQGLLEARPKSGFFVCPPRALIKAPVGGAQINAPQPVTVNELLLDIMRRSGAFDLLPELNVGDPPPGIVALNRAIGRSLRRQRGDDFQYYDDPNGDQVLREKLAQQYARRGCSIEQEKLCITSGCQHALFLALMACCRAGDVVAVESPGFYGSLQLLEELKLQVVEVPASIETGMDIDALEEILNRWKIKACIVSPAFATPGGALMPISAKTQLLDLAEQHDLAIIEDDIYADIYFDSVADPLKALDRNNRVILCSSFSKSLSRDLRLGWISGARWHAHILHLKLVTQLASSRYLQQGMAAFIEAGELASHFRRQRRKLYERRDQLLSILREWPLETRSSLPRGGLAVWIELPPSVDTVSVYTRALKQGIVITPGPLFSVSGQFKNCLRISYAHAWDSSRAEALMCLPELFSNK